MLNIMRTGVFFFLFQTGFLLAISEFFFAGSYFSSFFFFLRPVSSIVFCPCDELLRVSICFFRVLSFLET